MKTPVVHLLTLALGFMLSTQGCQESISPRFDPYPTGLGAPIAFRALAFSHPDTGYAVGGYRFESTVLLRTTDGGATWEPELTPEPVDRVMYCAWAESEGPILAGGNHDQWLRRGGDGLWQPTFAFFGYPWVPLRAVARRDDSTLMAVAGVGYDQGLLIQGTNEGGQWQLVDSFDLELRDIHFTSPQVGFMAGFGVVYKTTDGGATWEFTPAENDFFVSLAFVSEQVGYVVGRAGSILQTTDAGQTWQVLRDGNRLWLPRHRYHKIRFWDQQTGYLVGDRGLMLRTQDGGETWQRVALPTEADIYDLYLYGPNQGYLAGSEGLLARFEG